nr:vegetative cell wall protein gp1-like [Lolium perenne]
MRGCGLQRRARTPHLRLPPAAQPRSCILDLLPPSAQSKGTPNSHCRASSRRTALHDRGPVTQIGLGWTQIRPATPHPGPATPAPPQPHAASRRTAWTDPSWRLQLLLRGPGQPAPPPRSRAAAAGSDSSRPHVAREPSAAPPAELSRSSLSRSPCAAALPPPPCAAPDDATPARAGGPSGRSALLACRL